MNNFLVPGSGFHQFVFRVKFYSSEPSINLQEEITRYQFVLQLKHDILKGILPVSYETTIELSAQALQGTNKYFTIQYRNSPYYLLSTKHSFPYPKINEFISSLTAELGDYQPDVHDPDLISEFLFCPTQDERMELETFERFKELRYDIIQ